MRCPKFMLLVVAAILMGAANMPPVEEASAVPAVADNATVADPSPSTAATSAGPVVAPPTPAPDPTPGNPTGAIGSLDPSNPLATIDVGQIASVVRSPYGILLITAGLVYILLEILKGLVRSSESWTPARKRSIAFLGGAGIGALLSLAGPVPWWVGLIVGLVGAGIPVGGRALGTGLRSRSLIAVCALSVGLMASMGAAQYACSAAQVKAWQDATIVGTQCYAECGVDKVSGYVQHWKDGQSINGEDVGWDALSCLWPCLARAGATLVPALAISPPETKAEATTVAATASALSATPDALPLAAICRLKPETLDNSKIALRQACGCGEVPRCAIVIRTPRAETGP